MERMSVGLKGKGEYDPRGHLPLFRFYEKSTNN